MMLKYKGIRGVMGRESLEDFKKSTLLTFFEVLSRWNLKEGRDYNHNQQAKVFHFNQTGSDMYYTDLAFYPSDPEYNYLGSTEYTFSFIDEANQVRKKAKSILRTRLRYKLAENNLVPKMLLGCNPDKGHLYTDFYKPNKEGTLPIERKFVQALVKDNPFIDPTYIKNLESMDDIQTKERLLFGNWEYDADPAKLIDYLALTNLFSNIIPPSKDKFIVADIARFGSDSTVISYWEGFKIKRIEQFKHLPLVPDPNNPTQRSSASIITEWRTEYAVPISNVLVDEDGMGGGVRDYLGCKGFVANSSPFKGENYVNLKAQCSYMMARKINANEIGIECINEEVKQKIIEEGEQVKSKNADRDGKRAIIGKDEIKSRIGRSPDFMDTIMMRMYFEYRSKPNIIWV